jgi:hypothetical protein
VETYRLNYRYKNYATCVFVGIDKQALENKKRELDSNPDFTTHEICEKNVGGVLYQDMTIGSQFLNFIKGDAVFVGERHVDSRCTGMRRFYTRPENKELALAQFNKERAGQKESSDRYYSQPWV